MYDAELYLRLRIDGFYRLGQSFQAVHAGDEDVGDAPVLQLRDDLQLVDDQRLAPSADRVVRLEPGQLRPRIALRDVSFCYVPGVPVLRDITLDIEPGEAIGLVGSSGAGKSTLVDLLLGLLEPDSGEILIQGWPIAAVRPQWLQTIGYVPQSIAVFDDTVRTNIALGVPRDEIDDEKVWATLAFAQLDEVIRSLPDGLDHLVGEVSRELGLTQEWPVAIVGVGNLGRALANYRGFGARGFEIVALVVAASAGGWIFGSLLPHVISGAAVVSIVMSLPTTGPMLLDALRSQDMFLAGSFLMFMAFMTVIGVFLSDLALAALDPRIRLHVGR